jgi:hypothetical protein
VAWRKATSFPLPFFTLRNKTVNPKNYHVICIKADILCRGEALYTFLLQRTTLLLSLGLRPAQGLGVPKFPCIERSYPSQAWCIL